MEIDREVGDVANQIVEAALRCHDAEIIKKIRVGESECKNELLFFIKPEVFLLDNISDMIKITEMMLLDLYKFGVKIDGICAVNGSVLDKYNIMSKHYRFINIISNSASVALDSDTKRKIEEAYGLSPGKYTVLGGHEYLKEYSRETPESLDKAWFEEKSVKIRSGLYTRHIKKDGRDIVLVNGFHPKQLFHFTNPSHRIVLMLLHADTKWSTLKNEMVGAAFPEKAAPDSMRGELYKNAKDYGLKSVTVENNCMHLSAGPFEAMAEVVNFFSAITKMDIKKERPLMLKKMLSAGIDYGITIKTLDNPEIEYRSKRTDLFTATEEMDSDEAISLFKETLKAGKQEGEI
jgi:hypothetical protein